MTPRPRVALVHDYLTQLGGAERVALELTHAFPDAPLYTSIYAPELTYPEFRDVDVRTTALDKVPLFREHHRAAFPFLAPAFSAMHVDADVVVCSSSGWAHGARTSGPKVVYCHAVARWLSQRERYLGTDHSKRTQAARAALALMTPALRRWDKHAAHSATRYLANSAVTRDFVHATYGIEAQVVNPPATVLDAPARPLPGVEPGFFLVVSRLLPYKHVDAVCDAFAELPDERLVVVGVGPERDHVLARAGDNVEVHGLLDDGQLRWCYEHSAGLVAASREDFGLTVLEAAAAGRSVAALHDGGYLETVVDGTTGLFFPEPVPHVIADAVRQLRGRHWDAHKIHAHAAEFAPAQFRARMQTVVDEVSALS
jgi:glycosyltransferase involved in cell wall biosynthesis